MSEIKGIPVTVEPVAPFGTSARSGEKYLTAQGFTAIRDGQKSHGASLPVLFSCRGRWGKGRANG